VTEAKAARRTQAERRATTRQALLDAGLAALVDEGVAGFTTTEVVRRAGVSQGSLFKHFGSKQALWAATIEHLFAQMRADWEQRVARVPDADRTPERAVDLLWEVMQDPRLAAAFELYAVARTDQDLRADLQPVVAAHVAGIHRLSEEVLPRGLRGDGQDRGALAAVVDLVVLALQGLVVEEMVAPAPEVRERLLSLLRTVAVEAAA